MIDKKGTKVEKRIFVIITKIMAGMERPKCPISNFRSKNRPNWSERLLGPLKYVPDRSRVIGNPPATSGRILKLSHIEVIFNSPISIRIDLNCPFFSFAFFVLCLRVRTFSPNLLNRTVPLSTLYLVQNSVDLWKNAIDVFLQSLVKSSASWKLCALLSLNYS